MARNHEYRFCTHTVSRSTHGMSTAPLLSAQSQDLYVDLPHMLNLKVHVGRGAPGGGILAPMGVVISGSCSPRGNSRGICIGRSHAGA